MKTTEQTLLILDNDAEFKPSFDKFKDVITSAAILGFSYRGKPLEIVETNKHNGTPSLFISRQDNGDHISFRNDLPMSLFNAGYRIQQFGLLFVSANQLSFSDGSHVFSAFKTKICRSLRKEVGYNESVTHDEEAAALALLGRIMTSECEPS